MLQRRLQASRSVCRQRRDDVTVYPEETTGDIFTSVSLNAHVGGTCIGPCVHVACECVDATSTRMPLQSVHRNILEILSKSPKTVANQLTYMWALMAGQH